MIRSILIAILLVVFTAGKSSADQNDPRLNDWFESLAKTTDSNRALLLSRQIWNAWLTSGDSAVDELMETGIVLMERRHFSKARDIFSEIIRVAPDYAEGWNKRATVYYLMGRYRESVTDIEQTLKLEPRHFGAYSGLGQIRMHQGDYLAALSAFREAEALYPLAPGIRQNLRALQKLLQETII